MMKRKPGSMAVALSASLVLAACGSGSTSPEPVVGVSAPDRLLQSRAVDRSSLRPIVTLSTGQTVAMQRVDDSLWSGTVQVTPDSTVDIDILWVSDLQAGALELAGQQQQVLVGSDGRALFLDFTSYSYDFDADGDGVSNFNELEAGTDPFPGDQQPSDIPVSDDTPAEVPDIIEPVVVVPVVPIVPVVPVDTDENTDDEASEDDIEAPSQQVAADVIVPRISRSDAPDIDGLGVVLNASGALGGEWAAAIQVDSSGTPLGINNLMIDLGADAPNGTPWRRWAAMHDGTYLYVVVIVEDNGSRLGDGPLFWQDDSLELFLDGNYSRASSYVDDDDRHLIMPLLEPGTTRSPNSNDVAGYLVGPFSSEEDVDIDFATGPGNGPDGLQRPRFEQDVYELRIDLNSANIDVESPFGFELQVNDDDDGGPRDSKWGWAHPARDANGPDIDFTYVNPSFMGTLYLD